MTRKPRPAARLLMLDPDDCVLMFRFNADNGAVFWATPGGACDPGETHEIAARREMAEETGWVLDPGPEICRKVAEFTTLEGEDVWSDERYFAVRVPERRIDIAGHTELERRVMQHHHWWSVSELRSSDALIYPEDIADLVEALI